MLLTATGAACQPPATQAGPTPPSASVAASTASRPPSGLVTVQRLPGVMPVELEDAAILAAFDPESASALASGLPTDHDWTASGVICVYLGQRSDGGWALAIHSASLVAGELRILARETQPAGGGGQAGPTFPADCVTIDRLALPVGTLPVRADDTVHEEFIVADDILVPAP